MKVAILFGAGASAFSGPTEFTKRDGSTEERRPPLGFGPTGLFARLEEEGGVAAWFEPELKEVFRRDFEAGMAKIEYAPVALHTALQRQIALHLARFKVQDNNHYLQLIRPRKMRSKEILYATLNYDMLLDQAFEQFGLSIEGGPMESPSPKYITLLKLHGACNVLMKISGSFHGNSIVDAPFGLQGIGNFKLYLASTFKEINEWCKDPHHEEFAPAVAQYVKGKSFLNSGGGFVQLQQFWADHIMGVDEIILVGVRYVEGDEHIWGPLHQTPATISVVNPDCTDILKWGESRAGETRQIARLFSEVSAIQDVVTRAIQKQ